MKPLILYHADCVDGYGAAFCVWLHYRDEAEYVPVAHGSIRSIEDLSKLPDLGGRKVYIIDFSFIPDVQAEVVRRAGSVLWLDHHATSFKQHVHPTYLEDGGTRFSCCQGGLFTMLDNDRSGARLAWDHFFPDTALPWLLAYVDDFDREQYALPGSTGFNLAMRSHQWTFELWEQWLQEFGDVDGELTRELTDFLTLGQDLLRLQDAFVASIETDAIPCLVPGFPEPGLAVACPMLFVNDVGARLAQRSGTFALCWLIQPDGQAKCSLRSVGGCDVAQIAEFHGGGGHSHSAAFRASPSDVVGWFG